MKKHFFLNLIILSDILSHLVCSKGIIIQETCHLRRLLQREEPRRKVSAAQLSQTQTKEQWKNGLKKLPPPLIIYLYIHIHPIVYHTHTDGGKAEEGGPLTPEQQLALSNANVTSLKIQLGKT